MLSLFMMILKLFLKYLPQSCMFCGKSCDNFDLSPVCSNCFPSLEKWGKSCTKCGKKMESLGICGDCLRKGGLFDFLFHIYSYEGRAKEIINLYKFKGAWYFSKIFSIKIMEIIKNLPENFQKAPITYVPAHPYRIFKRNYHPVEYLVKVLCDLYNKESFLCLKKIKWKKPQTSLSKLEREKNVKGTFKIIKKDFPKSLILIDDIYTTGATLKECAKVLRKAGAENISAITLARTL